MRHGFYARAGHVFGGMSMTRGLGGVGTEVIDFSSPDVVDDTIIGARAPRAVATHRRAPKGLLYTPGAKKKRGGP